MVSLADSHPSSPPSLSGDRRVSIDPKNRITIPAKCRIATDRTDREPEELQVLRSPNDPCLLAFRQPEFEATSEKIRSSNLPDPLKKSMGRMFHSSARQTTVDKQGRMVLLEEFRTALDLEGEVSVIGAGDHFEIWNADLWEAKKNKEFEDYKKAAAALGIL